MSTPTTPNGSKLKKRRRRRRPSKKRRKIQKVDDKTSPTPASAPRPSSACSICISRLRRVLPPGFAMPLMKIIQRYASASFEIEAGPGLFAAWAQVLKIMRRRGNFYANRLCMVKFDDAGSKMTLGSMSRSLCTTCSVELSLQCGAAQVRHIVTPRVPGLDYYKMALQKIDNVVAKFEQVLALTALNPASVACSIRLYTGNDHVSYLETWSWRDDKTYVLTSRCILQNEENDFEQGNDDSSFLDPSALELPTWQYELRLSAIDCQRIIKVAGTDVHDMDNRLVFRIPGQQDNVSVHFVSPADDDEQGSTMVSLIDSQIQASSDLDQGDDTTTEFPICLELMELLSRLLFPLDSFFKPSPHRPGSFCDLRFYKSADGLYPCKIVKALDGEWGEVTCWIAPYVVS